MFGRRQGIDRNNILHYEYSIDYLLHTINHFRKDIDLKKLNKVLDNLDIHSLVVKEIIDNRGIV